MIPPSLAGKGAAWVPQKLLTGGVARLFPAVSWEWVSGDLVLLTLPVALITCQQLL